MSRWRLAIVLGVTGCLTFQVGSAHAQASSCVKIMLEYVGKPLAKAFAEKGAGLSAEYFVSKLNQRQHAGRSDSSANQLTQRDLRNCGRSMRGMERVSVSFDRTSNKS